MSNLTLNLTEAQNELMRSFFDGLTGAGGLSSADYTALADALEFGTLEEVSLTSTRYEVNLFGVGHVAQGAVIYSGTGFQTAGWDGNPLTLTDGTIDLSSIINSIEIRNPLGQEMFVLRGGLSGIEMLGSETTAGSFNLTELQLGSQAAGTLILFKGNLTAALTSPNLTLDGSISELTLYVRNGTNAYELKLTGNLSPSASLMEQVNGDITTISSNLDGELNALGFTQYTYADAVSQTPTGTQTILDASGLHLTAEDLDALMSAAKHDYGPDISFSLDGQAVTDIGTATDDRTSYVALQADGKVLVSAFTNQYGNDPQFNIVRYNSDGTLDTSFDGDGKFSTLFPSGSNGANWVGVGQQADGKINVVALRSSNDMVHLRLNADGSLDTSLDGDGISQISLSPLGLGMASHAKSLDNGKELVSFSGGFKLAQFNTDGSLDTSFGGGDGITEIPLWGSATRIATLTDGSILVVGTIDNQITLARFTAAGLLDTTFNNGSGYATVSIGSSSYANSVTVQADGKILVGGSSNNGSNNDFAIARFNANGTLDTSFHSSWDVSGRLTHDPGLALGMGPGWDNPYSLLIDVNGDILMTGMRYPSQSGQDPVYVISRFGSDGWHKETLTTALGASDLPTNAVLQSDGALLVGSTNDGDIAVTRLLPSQTAIDQILLAGDDTLTANTDVGVDLHGYQGNDSLTAGSGNDRLFGGQGNDSLTGGSGKDQFVIKTLSGIDTLTDFNSADDTIVLVGPDFTNYVADRAARFKLTTEALDADDRLLYDPATGAVFYDSDGSGAAAAIQFATLAGAPAITYDDFYLNPTNAAIVMADAVTTSENSAVTFDVLANDYLPEGWALNSFFLSSGSGSVMRNSAGHLLFTPDSSYDSLKVGDSATATISYWVMNESTFSFMQGAATVTITGEDESQSGTAGPDTLIGTTYADILLGLAGDDTLLGGDGNDLLDGGAGADTLTGGAGDDTFVIDNTGDSVIELAGGGLDTICSTISSGLANYVENLTLTATAAINGTGNLLDNVIRGNDNNNFLKGGNSGSNGNDTLYGGGGNDTLDGGEGDDVAYGGDGDDVFDEGNEYMDGGAGNDQFYSLGNNLTIDTMRGGDGSDTYAVNNATTDLIIEDVGQAGDVDTVNATVTWTLGANMENLVLGGADGINGTGNSLDNVITGNNHNNMLTGGDGNDTFVFALLGNGSDTIADFGTGDRIRVTSASLLESITAGNGSSLAQGQVQLSVAADTTTLYVGTNATPGADIAIQLTGTYQAGNFLVSGSDIIFDSLATGGVFLSGTPTQNQMLVASNTIVDADGMATLGYQWQSSSDGTLWNDAGNGDALMLTEAEVGRLIRVVASFTDNHGVAGNFISDATAAVVNVNDPPALAVPPAPTFTDTATNDTFTLASGTLVGNDVDAGTELSYGIEEGAANGDGTVSKTSPYGTLTVTMSTGAWSFTPNDAAIEALAADATENFMVTVSDGSVTASQILAINFTGANERIAADSGNSNHTYTGGGGDDEISYSAAQLPIVANLAIGTASGGDIGTDTLIGFDNIVGGAAGDILGGNDRANRIDGGKGNDSLFGAIGNDTLLGGDGNDLLDGGRGADRMEGGTGNDLYVVDQRFDQIIELADSGVDSVSARISHGLADHVENLFLTGSVTVRSGGFASRKTTTFDLSIDGTGNEADNLLRGNRGHNQLDGLGGNDTLLGGAGADVLTGGAGADRLVGGAGGDVFVFTADDGGSTLAAADLIYDFEDGIDRIALAGGLDFADLTISQGNGTDTAAGNTVIGTSSGEYLAVLLTTSSSSITALDFSMLSV